MAHFQSFSIDIGELGKGMDIAFIAQLEIVINNSITGFYSSMSMALHSPVITLFALLTVSGVYKSKLFKNIVYNYLSQVQVSLNDQSLNASDIMILCRCRSSVMVRRWQQ